MTKKFWALSKIFKEYNPSFNDKGWLFLVLTHIRDRSLFIAWGGGGGFWGDYLILLKQKGGSVVTENPKGGITESFGRIERGTTKICSENEDMKGGGGSRKSSNVIRGDHFSEVTFKGRIG